MGYKEHCAQSSAHQPKKSRVRKGLCSYNDDALTLTKAVSGEAFDNYLTMTPPRKFTSGCNLLWDGVEIQTEDVRDGDIVTLWTHS